MQKVWHSSITWTAEVDEVIMRMIAVPYSYAKIASELVNGLKTNDIKNSWTWYLKKSTDIIKPLVQKGQHSSIALTAEVSEAITCMIADSYSYAKIASELGNGLKTTDIHNRWTWCLKKSTDIKLAVL